MNISLVDIEEKHLDLILSWRNSVDVKKYMYTENEISKEQQKKWFKYISEIKTEKHFLVKMKGMPIGVANIKEIDLINKNAEWAFYIGEKQYRGSAAAVLIEFKIIEYAFNTLNLHKLNCAVLDFNVKTIQLHKKIGFVEEGIRREQIKKVDRYCNVHVLGMTKSEWLIKKKRLLKIVERYELN